MVEQNKPEKGKPVQITLPICPQCRQPLVLTKQGEYCPHCGYKRLKEK